MTTAAIIVAAGRGTRMGGQPKQWRDLAGRSVVQRSVDAFARHPGVSEVIVVVPEGDDRALWPQAEGLVAGRDRGRDAQRLGARGAFGGAGRGPRADP